MSDAQQPVEAHARATLPPAYDTGAWTRHISRDLFPGAATPYAWTLLASAADDALRGAYRTLGAVELGGGALWRRSDEGRVYLNAAALTDADASLRGAAWLGSSRPAVSTGLLARLQGGAAVRRAQAAIATAVTAAPALHARLLTWLNKVAALRWTQADLLQVMEELEPNARAALQTYFILRMGLPAVFLPFQGAEQHILAGARGLPTVDAAASLAEAALLPADDPARAAAIARYGHRGPGEIGSSAHRWAAEPDLLAGLRSVLARGGRNAPVSPHGDAPREALALVQAADTAWDALTVVAAASQRWVQFAATEALAAGLITRPADVLYLELEELKQVATGEWHGGRSAAVQEQVEQRRAAMAPADSVASPAPARPASGAAPISGPAYLGAPPDELPPAGAVWLTERPDPGCAPYWRAAAGIVAAAADPWSPGVIAARALGVPCITGGADVVESARPGETIAL
jgi:hypothetical protein